jgi:hypothetical protein
MPVHKQNNNATTINGRDVFQYHKKRSSGCKTILQSKVSFTSPYLFHYCQLALHRTTKPKHLTIFFKMAALFSLSALATDFHERKNFPRDVSTEYDHL